MKLAKICTPGSKPDKREYTTKIPYIVAGIAIR